MRNGIIKRGSTYSYVVRELDPSTGRSRQRWKGGFKTHAEAATARDEARVAARRGESVGGARQTLTDYLHHWLDQLDVKPKTKASYAYNVDHYIVPRIGGLMIQDLRPVTLTRFYSDLRATGGRDGNELGFGSVQAVHRTLSSALATAARLQLIYTNPAERAQLPPRPRATTRRERTDEELRVLTPSQLSQFLSSAAGHRLSGLYWLAAYTGARRGELLHLRWEDIDLERGRIHIYGSRTTAGAHIVEGTPKGGRSRTVSIDAATVAVLRDHRARQAEDRLRAGPAWREDGDYVFRTVLGLPIHPDTPSRLMRERCEAAAVPRIRFHDLRHTHATILLSAGVPVHEVADRLGHADATITLKVYAKVLRDRANGLGDVFASAMGSHG
ncbi:tyrosine-type recombinase/integrase [Nocardioides sp.]|uniref:site-specific integrase n=1 Tax=Nocardioides sp. TaxID=35761 RepID=UPI003783179C